MSGSIPKIQDHEEIVSECEGCIKIYKRLDGKFICAAHSFPHIKWWFGDICRQATHIEHIPDEDPIKEP